MNDTEFNVLANQTLDRIEQALDLSGLDLDCSRVGDGVLEIEFESGAKIIVNRHAAAQEIWLAARSGGFHFRWDGQMWRDTRDTRDSGELMSALSRLVSDQSGETIRLD